MCCHKRARRILLKTPRNELMELDCWQRNNFQFCNENYARPSFFSEQKLWENVTKNENKPKRNICRSKKLSHDGMFLHFQPCNAINVVVSVVFLLLGLALTNECDSWEQFSSVYIFITLSGLDRIRRSWKRKNSHFGISKVPTICWRHRFVKSTRECLIFHRSKIDFFSLLPVCRWNISFNVIYGKLSKVFLDIDVESSRSNDTKIPKLTHIHIRCVQRRA